MELKEKGRLKGIFRLRKFENDQALKEDRTYFDEIIGENLMMNAGINLMLTLLAGGAGTVYSNANSYLGVGDSSTAAAATQTTLQAVTNKAYAAMNSGYPTYGTSQQIVFQSNFGSSVANYAWNEMAVFNGNGTGTMLDRLVSSQGTKTSGQTWQLTLTITES